MQINITLVIQMVQFLIAYWFLHRYIFAPAYKIITKEDLAIEKLEGEISVLQHSMIEQEVQNQKRVEEDTEKLQSTVSEDASYKKKPVDLSDVDLYDGICDLQDEQVEKGKQFLKEHVVKIDEASNDFYRSCF